MIFTRNLIDFVFYFDCLANVQIFCFTLFPCIKSFEIDMGIIQQTINATQLNLKTSWSCTFSTLAYLFLNHFFKQDQLSSVYLDWVFLISTSIDRYDNDNCFMTKLAFVENHQTQTRRPRRHEQIIIWLGTKYDDSQQRDAY